MFMDKSLYCLTTLELFLKKSGESIYVMYRGATRVGFFYLGRVIKHDALNKIYQKYTPEDYNNLNKYVVENTGRIDYLLPGREEYVFVGERLVTKK